MAPMWSCWHSTLIGYPSCDSPQPNPIFRSNCKFVPIIATPHSSSIIRADKIHKSASWPLDSHPSTVYRYNLTRLTLSHNKLRCKCSKHSPTHQIWISYATVCWNCSTSCLHCKSEQSGTVESVQQSDWRAAAKPLFDGQSQSPQSWVCIRLQLAS